MCTRKTAADDREKKRPTAAHKTQPVKAEKNTTIYYFNKLVVNITEVENILLLYVIDTEMGSISITCI